MTANTWTLVPAEDFDDRPVYGPPCGVTPQGHTWRLSLNEGQAAIHCGCEECEDAVLGMVGMDGVDMVVEIPGTVRFESDHPNLGGWHGDVRCDCNWWWVFEPVGNGSDREAQP